MNAAAQEALDVITAADIIGGNNTQFGDAIEIVAEAIERHGDSDTERFINYTLARINSAMKIGLIRDKEALMVFKDVVEAVNQ